MKKNLFNIFLTLCLVWTGIGHAHAETDPKMLMAIDCNTLEKQVNVGYLSNPDDPTNGPEIIAFKYVLTLTATGTATAADIVSANAKANPALSNVVVAENKSEKVGDSVKITFAGGFTGGSGLPRVDSLFSILGTSQKSYQLTVTSGELYPKNSTVNAYIKSNEGLSVDPSTCGTTPAPTTPSTTPATTPAATGTATSISITADKTTAKTGETVVLTAIITNRNGQSVDWAQTGGSKIDTPDIKNEELPDGTTKSTFTAKMPANSTADLSFKLNVGTAEERATIIASDKTGGTAADTATHGAADQSLADKLKARREELNAQAAQAAPAQPGNVHGAAEGLSKSGPEDTALLLFGSLAILYGWKRLRRSEV